MLPDAIKCRNEREPNRLSFFDMYLKYFILADLAGIALLATDVSSNVIDGWSKLGAIGVLSALLAIMMYRFPEISRNISEPHKENLKNTLDSHEKTIQTINASHQLSTSVLSDAIERQTKKIEEQNESNRDHQRKHLELLERVLKDRGEEG